MTQNGRAPRRQFYINFTMVFDGSGAICRFGGYEHAKRVDKIRTLDDELN